MRTKLLFFLLMPAILCPALIKAADLVVSGCDAEDYLNNNGAMWIDDIETSFRSSSAGMLAKKGADYNTRVFTVSGPINEEDLAVLWEASLLGNLVEIDLGEAELEGGIVPDFAFWNESGQVDTQCGHTRYIRLKKIVLPKNCVEIGKYAFANAINLDEVVFPAGLEKIDESAFYNCGIKEVVLPNSCVTFDGTSHFMHNVNLGKMYLPEGIESIPVGFVEECIFLEDIRIPATVKYIGDRAFLKCRSLKSIELPPALETIGDLAFFAVDAMERISFPATLKSLGKRCCEYMTVMRNIYCAASEPPVCEKLDTDTQSVYKPFGVNRINYNKITWEGARIHVPVGSAEKYRKAWGWDYFTNFVETEEFPDAAVEEVIADDDVAARVLYDLHGRQVLNPQEGHLYISEGKTIVYKKK